MDGSIEDKKRRVHDVISQVLIFLQFYILYFRQIFRVLPNQKELPEKNFPRII